ncbi:MAG TPA: TPM domain-containing protein [Gemmatimonadaceae bacterium]
MKRSLTTALVFALSASSAAIAQDAPPIARYVPSGPDQRHVFVTDSAHILSDATIRALQDSAQALQSATGADLAWVTLPTLGGRAIEDATVYLGRTWRIGSAGQPGDPLRNRGLVILYVPDKSRTAGSNFRVEVGTGLQGTIIDSRSRAITTAMRDDLRAKRYDAGYLKGWSVAAAMVREDFASQNGAQPAAMPTRGDLQARTASPRRLPVFVIPVFLLLALVAFIVWLVRLGSRRRRSVGNVPSPLWMAVATAMQSNDDDRRRRGDSDSSWFGSDSRGDSSSSSDSSGGDFGGGGGFDGGGSSDSI